MGSKYDQPPMSTPTLNVAIIGAGASGIIIAKALLAEPGRPFRVCLFERRRQIGGTWYYKTNADVVPGGPLGTDERTRLAEPGRALKRGTFASPMYAKLTGNICYRLYELPDLPYSESELRKHSSAFPDRDGMLEYVERYAGELSGLVTTDTEVLDCSKTGDKWTLTLRNLTSDPRPMSHDSLRDAAPPGNSPAHPPPLRIEQFDRVVVAAGNYETPLLPNIPGLSTLIARYPDRVMHSKFFDKPEIFAGKRVLVIGNGPSGLDIAQQAIPFARGSVYLSGRTKAKQAYRHDHRLTEVGVVESFDVNDGHAVLKDGTVLPPLDMIVLATGYGQDLRFLRSVKRADEAADSFDTGLVSPGQRVRSLYEQLFYIADPTLAFACLLRSVVPFPIAQSQGCYLARVWSGRLALPSAADMLKAEADRVRETSDSVLYHTFGYPADAEYANELYRRCASASGTGGLMPLFWGEERCRLRRENTALKQAELDSSALQAE